MKDSDVAEFSNILLDACSQAVKAGTWEGPKEPGRSNLHCCPLLVLRDASREGKHQYGSLSFPEKLGFMRGYDLRAKDPPSLLMTHADDCFYELGKAFRERALSTGF